QLHRATRGHVAQMHVPAGELREEQVARHHDLFGGGGDSLETEPRGDQPFVHDAAARERRLLAVVGDGDIEGACILERGAHPAAAARAPLATVSTSSFPGSRRCTCRSTRPGATIAPRTSRTSTPSGVPSVGPTAAILPSWTRTSAV